MSDITEITNKYRETARHLWNSVFQFLDDGKKGFVGVEEALFISLVLNQAEPYIDKDEIEAEYVSSIEVLPEFGPKGTTVMYAFQSGNSWNWKEIQLSNRLIKLKLIHFFDWKEYEYREFQYARVRVIECTEHADIVGSDMLVEAGMCNYNRV